MGGGILKRGFFVWMWIPSASSEDHFLGVSLGAAVLRGAQSALRCPGGRLPVSLVVVRGGGGGGDPHPLAAVRLVVVGRVGVVPLVLPSPVRVGHRVGAEIRVAQVIQPVEPAQVGVATTASHSETGTIIT